MVLGHIARLVLTVGQRSAVEQETDEDPRAAVGSGLAVGHKIVVGSRSAVVRGTGVGQSSVAG